jgi:hypothetical protein
MAGARKTATKPVPRNRMGSLLDEFMAWMRMRNTAEYTQYHRRACVARFIRWAIERGIEDPMEVTRLILEKAISGISTTTSKKSFQREFLAAYNHPHGVAGA